MGTKIAILLATYNGEKYLSQQLDSILNQTYQNIKIYVSDDFSTDKTMDILKEYSLKYADRIVILPNEKKLGGACNNFLSLVERVDSDIYFFCDQDDVWNSDKIEKTVRCFETQSDKNIPLLVHSDLKVVDANLNEISPSFLSLTNKSKHLTWKEYLVENNNVVGCTSAINKSLAKMYIRNYQKINKDKLFMHDSFFALLASIAGNIEFIDEALINYRQHGNNSVGAKKKSNLFISIHNKVNNLKSSKKLFRQREENVGEVLKCCNELNNEKVSLAKEFSNLYLKHKYSRIFFLVRHGIKRKSFFENIYIWLAI